MKNIKLIFTIACATLYFSSSNILIGQDEIVEDNEIYTDVDFEATYEGGTDALAQFVRDSFNMPKVAMDVGASGIIIIQFVVEKDGTISDLRAIAPKERQLGYGLEAECMRVLRLTSGQWKPAMRIGEPVRSYWRFPFEIDNSGGY